MARQAAAAADSRQAATRSRSEQFPAPAAGDRARFRRTPRSPRDEIRPVFRLLPGGGRDGNADPAVLGETVPSANTLLSSHEATALLPSPSTDHFGALARKHDHHVACSLLERDAHPIYDTRVLIGPDRGLVGRYRKVCLPPGEAATGIAPGDVFAT